MLWYQRRLKSAISFCFVASIVHVTCPGCCVLQLLKAYKDSGTSPWWILGAVFRSMDPGIYPESPRHVATTRASFPIFSAPCAGDAPAQQRNVMCCSSAPHNPQPLSQFAHSAAFRLFLAFLPFVVRFRRSPREARLDNSHSRSKVDSRFPVLSPQVISLLNRHKRIVFVLVRLLCVFAAVCPNRPWPCRIKSFAQSVCLSSDLLHFLRLLFSPSSCSSRIGSVR